MTSDFPGQRRSFGRLPVAAILPIAGKNTASISSMGRPLPGDDRNKKQRQCGNN